VKLYVAAASSEVQAESELSGDWKVLLDAGAEALPPGCGACAGLGAGTIEAGEVGIASTNRNFKGRMGSRDGLVHLASPSTVAASAAEGYIVAPSSAREGSDAKGSTSTSAQAVEEIFLGQCPTPPTAASKLAPLIDSFPKVIEGDLLWCGADNISTDGIYHGRLMYEDLTQEQMAAAAMENYDPDFGNYLQDGASSPILASGSNFGTGSSREQAAQCLKYAGVTALIAQSYSATYTRNALNNGLPILECPGLAEFLRTNFGSGSESSIENPTVRTGYRIKMDLTNWQVELRSTAKMDVASDNLKFELVPIGEAAQELIACGGLEPWIKNQLST
jgi:homoaconitate hydratase